MIELKVVADTATPMLAKMERQMPFAMARALTRVAEDVKFEQARAMPRLFTVREPWIASPQRWVVTRAEKRDYPNLRSVVALDHQARFLADFEEGGARTMRAQPLAIPTKTLRATPAQKIERKFYPKNIGLLARKDPAGTMIVAGRGKHSRRKSVATDFFRMRPTLVDQRAAGGWHRMGSGKGLMRGSDNIRYLWKFVSQVRIPKVLGFVERAKETVQRRWDDVMKRSLDDALATAR